MGGKVSNLPAQAYDYIPPRGAMHRDEPAGSRLEIANAYATGRLIDRLDIEAVLSAISDFITFDFDDLTTGLGEENYWPWRRNMNQWWHVYGGNIPEDPNNTEDLTWFTVVLGESNRLPSGVDDHTVQRYSEDLVVKLPYLGSFPYDPSEEEIETVLPSWIAGEAI